MPIHRAAAAIAALTLLSHTAAVAHPHSAKTDKPGWTLTFDDEFSGKQLDRKAWIDSYPHGARTHNNGEQEYYAPDAVTVAHGSLHLNATHQPNGGMPYTSGMICSYGGFAQQYGWFEIRAKIPAGKGYWPAFWLLPSNGEWPPEIDALEFLCDNPAKIYMTNHWRDSSGQHQSHGESWTGPDYSQAYHTYAIDWEPGEITWYVDGVQRAHSTEGVPTEPMFVILNLAVGGDWPGNPDATTRFPAEMAVDWVRVYKKD